MKRLQAIRYISCIVLFVPNQQQCSKMSFFSDGDTINEKYHKLYGIVCQDTWPSTFISIITDHEYPYYLQKNVQSESKITD